MVRLEKKLRLKAPLIVQFEITPACNNNCGFCYNFWQYDKESTLSRQSRVDVNKIRKLMGTLLKYEVPAVCFTGGEPFLEKDILFELLDTAAKNKLYTSINTNGRLITKEIAEKLKARGLNSVLISLHGDSKQVHERIVGCDDAFSQTLKGIKNVVDAGINITVNYVSTQENVNRIIPTAEMLKDVGVRSMTVTPLLPFPGVKNHEEWVMKKEQFKQYFDSLVFANKKGLKVDSTLPIAPCILKDMFPNEYKNYLEVLSPRVCMAGVTFAVVSPEGFIRACIQAPQLSQYGGDMDKNFKDVWKNAANWSKLDLLPNECLSDCYALASCGGGCRTSSLAVNGSTCGKTMYMGTPFNLEESRMFNNRLEVKLDPNIRSFQKKKDVKFREEKFGGVLANISRQSFVILDKNGVNAYSSMPDKFEVNKYSRGIEVLYSAGILEQSKKKNLPVYSEDISVVHASRLFPRLAAGIPKGDKVRMLRADTGERIYF